MNEYLAFVDYVGCTLDGKYIYRFDFTTDTDVVWGEFFNVVPSAIIPTLQPDLKTLSSTAKAIFPQRMAIAKMNFCFSMQDCIDGIMQIIFSELDENTIMMDDTNTPFFLMFGEHIDKVRYRLNKIGVSLFEFEEVKAGDEAPIDELIESLGDNNNGEDFDL